MADLVNLTIDGVAVAVPKGTLIVDAAKKLENNIPVFCYHPKLKPVGMCRMCLVEIGTPKVDPATKQVIKDDKGNVVIAWQPKLNTACTNPVSEGMAVRTATPVVDGARSDVLEFLLTSHPLDCPVCDKGGECPLQNLTLEHGPGISHFDYESKQHNAKHVPLGDLIFLDRERCIQCSRCIRFQDDIADDHVLQFHDRGRHMEIVTMSEPGFDSYFSGNTTDICPVGALTTADFRFKARPWELDHTPSLCTHCAVGCNLSLNTRLETRTGGHEIKRIMPRQNEQVNEIWTCDKGRFVHEFTSARERLTKPLVRKNGALVETGWDEALALIADKLQGAGSSVAGVVGDRVPNEDAYLFGKLFREVLHANNGRHPVQLGMSPSLPMHYADVARAHGLGVNADFKQLGKGDTILIVNGDVEEQAPVWFLRLRQAVVDRGAKLIIAHHRSTKMHRYASRIITYAPGNAAQWLASPDGALDELKEARNLVVVFGDEKCDPVNARGLALGLAGLITAAGHAGKQNSGLLPLYPHANTQGVYDMLGLETPGEDLQPPAAVSWTIGVGEPNDVPPSRASGAKPFAIVQELFLTEIAQQADVVLPVLSFAERDGSFTSGDRRVQRFYAGLPVAHGSQAKSDWWIFQEIARRLGVSWSFGTAAAIFGEMAGQVGYYVGLNYDGLGASETQWPPMGREDLYYGGTVYDNEGGIGVRYPTAVESGRAVSFKPVQLVTPSMGALSRPARRLYQNGELIGRSNVIGAHIEVTQ